MSRIERRCGSSASTSTEASYSRYEEGKKAWVGIIAGTNDLGRQVICSVDSKSSQIGSSVHGNRNNGRFNRLAWGSYGSDSDGLIAGGLVDGNIGLWNPNRSDNSGEIELVGHLSNIKVLFGAQFCNGTLIISINNGCIR